jgi:cysteine desulfurase
MAASSHERLVYLDNHATTRVDPRVVEAMLPYFDEHYGNPGSATHAWGRAARAAVEEARGKVAAAIGAEPDEICFTSGATESNNLALRGAAEHPRRCGDHMISTTIEHPSVLEPLERLQRHGWRIDLIEVAPQGAVDAGRVDPQRIAAALTDDTTLVSVMAANNEVGAIQPIAEIAALCRQRGAWLHCDATQALGKIPLDVGAWPVDLMSFTAHKLYGPKGVGALYRRRTRPAVRLLPQQVGGGQEEGLRSGTLNVPGIVGFARAVELCQAELQSEAARLARLRNRLWDLLAARLPDARLIGPPLDVPDACAAGGPLRRLPGNLNVALGDVDGEAVMLQLERLAVSSGAACASGKAGPSHVLKALGLSDDEARSALRFGLGRFTDDVDVELAGQWIAAAVDRLRGLRIVARDA